MEKLKPKKYLGQNFLQNSEISRKIVDSITLDDCELVVEIGPGMGSLTNFLHEKVSNLILIEKDYEVCDFLKNQKSRLGEKIRKGIVKLFNEDVLSLEEDVKSILNSSFSYQIVGNLPFNIGKKILRIFLSGKEIKRPKYLTVMLQKEVAHQILGRKRSFLTFFTEFYSKKIKKICDVQKNCFYPIPKVDTTVLVIETKSDLGVSNLQDELNITNLDQFWKFLKTLFFQKRKKIKNTIKLIVSEFPSFLPSEIQEIFEKRVEDLDISEISILWRIYNESLGKVKDSRLMQS